MKQKWIGVQPEPIPLFTNFFFVLFASLESPVPLTSSPDTLATGEVSSYGTLMIPTLTQGTLCQESLQLFLTLTPDVLLCFQAPEAWQARAAPEAWISSSSWTRLTAPSTRTKAAAPCRRSCTT